MLRIQLNEPNPEASLVVSKRGGLIPCSDFCFCKTHFILSVENLIPLCYLDRKYNDLQSTSFNKIQDGQLAGMLWEFFFSMCLPQDENVEKREPK